MTSQAAGEMLNGVRKILLKRESKRRGKDVFAYKVPYRDGGGKQTSETFGTRRAAEAFRDKVRTQRHEGLVIDSKAGQVTLGAYAADWLATLKATRRESTYAAASSHVRVHLTPALGKRQLRALTRREVQTFVNSLSATLAPRSVHLVYRTLARIMRCALLDRIVSTSPCAGIALPEIPKGKVRALTAGEVAALAAEIGPDYRAAVLLAAGTGLRPSEVWGLTWDRIDLEAGTLTVDRQLHRDGKRLAPPKTKASRRIVPMPSMVADALRAHHPAHTPVPVDLDHADGYTVPGACLVFTSTNGRPVGLARFRDSYRLACAALRLPKTVTPHTLRHTYASLLIAGRTPLKAIQERLGHGSIGVTMDTYGHLYPSEDARTRDCIDDAFSATNDDDDPPAGALVKA